MSSVAVISGIIILLAALVCYAMVSQTLKNKRDKKKRLLAALKSQSRNFKFILKGCPDGFLSKELKLLVLRSLIDVSDQLTRLEPKEALFAKELKHFTQMQADTQREAPSDTEVRLENPQQIKEVKMSLEELNRFIFQLEGRARLSKKQGDVFRKQIKQLVLSITIDAYLMNGQAARQSQKTKLALHYYELALNLALREGKAGTFEQKIQQLRSTIEELNERLSEEQSEQAPHTHEIDEDSHDDLQGEWDKFSEESSSSAWKKKQIYD